MAASFFFYDLETSSVNPSTGRIMQFGGQRTGMDLQPIDEPEDIIIRLTPDVVPDPDAILVTGITPQKTLQEGISEAEFLHYFHQKIATPDTIFIGFNTVRFDDEFMRYMHYRNFYDPYEWQWKDGRSRWDILDLVRMTRALRPEGITWPFDSSGAPSNRLELLTSVNNLLHENAHDALSDVRATIAVAAMIQEKQPKLFEYLLSMRDKKNVAELVHGGKPFVYSSGKYPSEYEKTAVVHTILQHPKKQAVVVYDLRHDPTPYIDASPEKLVDLWRWKKDKTEARLPVKTLQFNRCPAIAPIGVVDSSAKQRLHINETDIAAHKKLLDAAPGFRTNLQKALEILDSQQQTTFLSDERHVDAQLYEGFIPDTDKKISQKLISVEPEEISTFSTKFSDPRLQSLVPLYKARNYPNSLDTEERIAWEKHCQRMLLDGGKSSRLAAYFARLGQLAESPRLRESDRYLLEELQLYGQSIMPVVDDYEDDFEA